MSDDPRAELRRCADEVGSMVRGVFASLDGIDARVRQVWEENSAAGSGPPSSGEFSSIARIVRERVLDPEVPLHGAGVLFAPGLLRDVDLHLEWWQNARQTARRLTLDFNPTSERYYDYPSTGWFATARDEHRATVAGPYVDLYGADTYIFTFARPVIVDETFIGVIGADVSLVDNEAQLTAPLKTFGEDSVLVTAEGRVIAASSPQWTPGMLFRPDDRSSEHRAAVTADAVEWEAISLG
jgi:hypothetical protein